jgi:hypothetical protein
VTALVLDFVLLKARDTDLASEIPLICRPRCLLLLPGLVLAAMSHSGATMNSPHNTYNVKELLEILRIIYDLTLMIYCT